MSNPQTNTTVVDVIVIGAGAAGLMCAIEAGKRGRRVLVLDHANKPGKKILMSGGGRCNFTNLHCSPDNFISHNPHFCKSALSRYTQWDFIDLVQQHKIPYHEKTLGQLFCDEKSKAILGMLLDCCSKANVEIQLNTTISAIEKKESSARNFTLNTHRGKYYCDSLVIATGGLSIPTMGATPFGYQIAEQFGLPVYPTRAGLVPITLHEQDKDHLSTLAGVSFDASVTTPRKSFDEATLITHRGLSGPAILQISSYWLPGEMLSINCMPTLNLSEMLTTMQARGEKSQLKTILNAHCPKRFLATLLPELLLDKPINTLIPREIQHIHESCHAWQIKPNGTEGYRTAEVTLGGVSCDALSSKTMEANQVPGLYFIGEVVDVTGWLGGFNFQWAWSSGWAAGQVV